MLISQDITSTLYGLFLLLALTSCRGDGARDIRGHYFPLRELNEGLVYEYRPLLNDSLTPAYWYYRSFFTGDGIFLTKTYYEYELEPLQLSREEVVSNGMLLQDLYLYEKDTTGKQHKVTAEVLSGSAFPFRVKDSTGVFLYKIQWHPLSDPEATLTLIKNRRFVKDTTVVYEQEERDAVVFDVRELVEYDKEGVFEHQYHGREVYAEGIGLFYYEKKVAGDFQWAYLLEKRYPMSRLEEKYNIRMEQQTEGAEKR
ncbi:MAG: hypothetical protein H6557_18415 [Lewinellaceae bacterium]|nr:hypothetical protein [Phaeodactylibacter sp.]MCB9038589.1 hypothetical protein [Lewinellaceae bacterium]